MITVLRIFFRFIIVAMIEALSILAMTVVVPGVRILAVEDQGRAAAAASVALVVALLNGIVRPVLVLLTLPINILSVGFSTLLINAGMLLLAGLFLPYFEVDGFGSAFLGAVVLAVVNTFLTSLTTIDDDYAFFDGVIQWLSQQMRMAADVDEGRGLVLLEIDGLSYQRMQRAIESGLMPTMKRLVEEGTHCLSHFDCGLPSQTSSSQAGIMYGDNHDIPAFRWYDKDRGKLIVSNSFRDAAELDGRFSKGTGLLRGGTSINNLMSGDARYALLTMSVLDRTISGGDLRSSEDLYLVFVNPYFFSRALVLTVGDMILEIFQAVRQRILKVVPRVNRLEKAYPLLRAITNVLLRDLSTYTVIMDVIRGSPAIYTTYVGYDEIAHHAGPDTSDAMNSLRGIDTQVKRVLDVIERKSPRPYDLFILSDHGQSQGATFLQRYGTTLTGYIESLVKTGTQVDEVDATENARGYVAALLAEIQRLENSKRLGSVTGAAIGQARKSLQKRLVQEPLPEAWMDSEVLVCVSGNLANVYLNRGPGKIAITDIEEAHPGLLQALVDHPGIGLVVAHAADGTPWAIGKIGAIELRTGSLYGQANPLADYGDPILRAGQLERVADFPHAGDLILISTYYENGDVAAFEELVGSHGGLGGQQTDAFLFHPVDMQVPAISNSTHVFRLLDARRGLKGKPVQPRLGENNDINAWSRANLLAGLSDIRILLSRVLRVIRLDRAVFREVSDDPRATGQALLIVIVLAIMTGLTAAIDPAARGEIAGVLVSNILGTLVNWIVVSALALAGGHLLRGRGTFTRTLRAIAFAQVPQALTWLGVIPYIGPLLRLTGAIMVWLTSWLALQEALKLSRWRALLIPLVGLAVVVVTMAGVIVVVSGAALTLETLLRQLGLPPL